MERTDDGSHVADCDLQSVGGRALCLAADVDGGPTQRQSYGGIDACGGEEGADVGDAWLLGRVCVRQEDDVADDCDGREAGDEDGAALELFARYGDGDG